MSKAAIVTVIGAYLFGAGSYLIAFAAVNWAGMNWMIAAAPEAFTKAAMWPYLVYQWIRFDMPLM